MNKQLKITKIGNSAGIVLPKEVLAHLERKVGDELTLVLKPGNSGDSILNPPEPASPPAP